VPFECADAFTGEAVVMIFALSTSLAKVSCCVVVAFWSSRLPWRCSALSTWLISTSWSSGARCELASTFSSTASRADNDSSCLFVVSRTLSYVLIFAPTYGAVVRSITVFASAFVAAAVLIPFFPSIVSAISGVVRAVPVAVPTVPTVT
jgi:hypothetical protein